MKITEAIGATNASDTQNRTRCRGSLTNRGFATVAALVIGVTLIGVVLVTTELAITQTRLSKRGESKATALFTADAGLDESFPAPSELIALWPYYASKFYQD